MQPAPSEVQEQLPGALVISLDFELHWGVRDKKAADGHYRGNLLGVREAVPAMLDLFARRGVHATWATVGLLFARSRQEMYDLAPSVRPKYADPRLDPYRQDTGIDERDDPLHFAPSLIAAIAASPGQEIATHTFSHFYCLEPGATEQAFSADLASARQAHLRTGYPPAKAIVFPRNQCNEQWDRALRDNGIQVFRGNPPAWMYRTGDSASLRPHHRAARLVDTYVGPSRLVQWNEIPRPNGLDNVRASFYFRPYNRRLRALDPLKIARFRRAVRQAAHNRSVVHFWWHPHNFGVNLAENMRALESVLDEFRAMSDRHGMRSLTMAEAADSARSLRPS